MTHKALKLALEALDGVLDDAPKVLDASISGGLYEVVQCREAITAIKEALRENAMREVQRLGQKIEQEPVKYSDYEPDGVHHTTPPQRTWVGLTDEDMLEAIKPLYANPFLAHNALEVSRDEYQAIEAKLKEKNT